MNIIESDILLYLESRNYTNQRKISLELGYSLGLVNRTIRKLKEELYIDSENKLSEKSNKIIMENSPKQAIILAAGFGFRMVPINQEKPKAFLNIRGELLIERIIRQLHEVQISDITIVVGFMKEEFEYLIDKFGVKLIVNPEYSQKNNLHSLKYVKHKLVNSYIIPSDVWFDKNPFRRRELNSWYMVTDKIEEDSNIRYNKKRELIETDSRVKGNQVIGVAYISQEDEKKVYKNIEKLIALSEYDDSFWEKSLFDNKKMIISARIFPFSQVIEINTYEQLRDIDENSQQLNVEPISIIEKCLGIDKTELSEIDVLKKGMTNRSFLFKSRNDKYIMRIPGEGTDSLINREHEAAVYQVIRDQKICDDIIYINPTNGYKITKFLPNVRSCSSDNWKDVESCIQFLKKFHQLELQVEHEFDLFGQIEFYESLWDEKQSAYKDYKLTKNNILSLKDYVEKHIEKKVLTHIDAVPDNFLFVQDDQEIRLIDWEYAGMQDPHLDIAMFCIYSLYERQEIDHVIDLYFSEKCPHSIRLKIYCYIAIAGLLWSNWCEYKRSLGIEFGEYSLRQYRYAKDYYRIVQEELQKELEYESD
ncbi:phosphotransferase [Streptococcus pneumoniae]